MRLSLESKKAVASPLITAGACALVMLGIVKFVLPKFLDLYDRMDLEFPLISRVVFGIVKDRQPPHDLVRGPAGGDRGLRFRVELRERLFELGLLLPWTRSVLGNVLCARVCETLSYLHSDGVPLHKALDLMVKTAPYRLHREALMDSRRELIATGCLSEALHRITYFPHSFHTMVAVGEESGSLDDLLEASRKFMDDEVEMVVSRITTTLEPLAVCAMGICMAFLFVACSCPSTGF